MMDRAAACVAEAEEMWRPPVGGPPGGGIRGRGAAAGVPAELSHADERGHPAGVPVGVRGAAAGRLAGVDLQDAGAGRPAALGRRRHQVLVLPSAAARRRGGQHREAASGPASFLAVFNTAAGVLGWAGGAAAPRWPCWISATRHRRVHRGQAGRRSGVSQPVARGDQQVHAGRDPGCRHGLVNPRTRPGHGHGERGGAGAGRCR